MAWSFTKTGDRDAVMKSLDAWVPQSGEPGQVDAVKDLIRAALHNPSFAAVTEHDGVPHITGVQVDANGYDSPAGVALNITVAQRWFASSTVPAPPAQGV